MLMFEQLKKTPQERIDNMQNAMRDLEKSERQVRGAEN
jgi:hypothetical protein